MTACAGPLPWHARPRRARCQAVNRQHNPIRDANSSLPPAMHLERCLSRHAMPTVCPKAKNM